MFSSPASSRPRTTIRAHLLPGRAIVALSSRAWSVDELRYPALVGGLRRGHGRASDLRRRRRRHRQGRRRRAITRNVDLEATNVEARDERMQPVTAGDPPDRAQRAAWPDE